MRYLYAILAFAAWGVNSTLILRALQDHGLPGPVSTFLGTAVGATVMLTVIGERGRLEAAQLFFRIPGRMAFQALAFSFTGMTYHLAMLKTTVANAALTHSLQPIFTCLLFAPILARKRPTGIEMFAVLLGLAGMFALLAPQLSWDGKWEGIAYGTLSAVCYSGSLLSVSRFPKDIDRKVMLAAILASGIPVLLPFALYAGFPAMDLATISLVIPFGLLGIVIANMFYFAALKRLSAGHVATLSYTEPVFAIVVAAVWLAEPVTANALLGGALILGSSGLIAYDDLRRKPRP